MLNKDDSQEDVDRNLKLLAKSSLIVFIGLFFSKFLGYFYRIIIARYFGPEVYGLFSLAIMVVGWFIAISSLGFSQGVLRYIPIYRGEGNFKKIKHLLRFSFLILFFSSFFAGIILFFSSNFISINIFHNPDLIIFLKIFSFLIPISIFSEFFLSILRSFEEISWYTFIFNILLIFTRVATLGLFIWVGFKSNSIIFSYFLGFVIILLVSFIVCKYKLSNIFGNYKLSNDVRSKINKEFFSYSWPIMFAGVLASIFYWIDSFSIGYFLDASQVGFYNAAIPIILLLNFVPTLFIQLFLPIINKEYSRKNFQLIKELSQQIGKWIFIFNLPLFLVIFFFPESILNLFFGGDYIIAQNALRILSVGSFISILFIVSNNLLYMIGKSKLILINILITSILNLVLNFWLVQKYGINGAAISTSIVGVILGIFFFVEAKYYLSIIPLRKKMIKIFIISFIPLVITLYLRTLIAMNNLSLCLLSGFFFLFYVLLIFLTGCLDKNDLMVLGSLKRKVFSKE